MPTIQQPLYFEESNFDYIYRLEKTIKANIAENIEEHRSKHMRPTSWEADNTDNIKSQLLLTFEQFKYKMRPDSIDSEKTKKWYMEAAQNLDKIKMVLAH